MASYYFMYVDLWILFSIYIFPNIFERPRRKE